MQLYKNQFPGSFIYERSGSVGHGSGASAGNTRDYRMPTTPRALRGEPFVFVGGLLVLDLLNTRPRPLAKATEFLRTTSDLAAWAEAAELPYAVSLRAELRAAGHAVTTRQGLRLGRPVNREPQLALLHV